MRNCRAFSAGSILLPSSSSEVGIGDDDVSTGTGILGEGASGRRRLDRSSVLLDERSSLRRGLLGLLLLPAVMPREVDGPGKGRRETLGAGGVGGDRGFSFSDEPLMLFKRRVSLGRGVAYSSLRLSRSESGRGDLYGDLEERPRPCFLRAVSIASCDAILFRA